MSKLTIYKNTVTVRVETGYNIQNILTEDDYKNPLANCVGGTLYVTVINVPTNLISWVKDIVDRLDHCLITTNHNLEPFSDRCFLLQEQESRKNILLDSALVVVSMISGSGLDFQGSLTVSVKMNDVESGITWEDTTEDM